MHTIRTRSFHAKSYAILVHDYIGFLQLYIRINGESFKEGDHEDQPLSCFHAKKFQKNYSSRCKV